MLKGYVVYASDVTLEAKPVLTPRSESFASVYLPSNAFFQDSPAKRGPKVARRDKFPGATGRLWKVKQTRHAVNYMGSFKCLL